MYAGSSRMAACFANAEIIRPFHAVRILSSRCGRGRLARAENKRLFVLRKSTGDLGRVELEVLRSFLVGVGLEQNVQAREFVVRIVLHVAGSAPCRSGRRTSWHAPRRADPPPRATARCRKSLRSFRADGRGRARCRHLRRNRTRPRARSCRASHNRACGGRPFPCASLRVI